MSEIAFDRETLKRYCDPKGQWGPTVRHVAAYALTLLDKVEHYELCANAPMMKTVLDRAERAERELREAEEAIGTIINRADRQTPEPFKSRARQLLSEEFPAVRRALDRKVGGVMDLPVERS